MNKCLPRFRSAKIKRIAADIASLTLLETVDLTAVLKDTLKMTDK